MAQEKTYPWFAEVILQNSKWGHLDRATDGASKKGSRATEPEALNAILGKDGLDAVAHASVVVLKADSNAGITSTLQVTLEQVKGVPKESTQSAAYCTAKQEKTGIELSRGRLLAHLPGENALGKNDVSRFGAEEAIVIKGLVGPKATAIHNELIV